MNAPANPATEAAFLAGARIAYDDFNGRRVIAQWHAAGSRHALAHLVIADELGRQLAKPIMGEVEARNFFAGLPDPVEMPAAERRWYDVVASWCTTSGGMSWWSGPVQAFSASDALDTVAARIKRDKRRRYARAFDATAYPENYTPAGADAGAQ